MARTRCASCATSSRQNRPRRILEDLTAARVVRAAESERQLNEVLVDFWMNHFNVYANKGVDRILVASFERDAIRPRIWGRFEDLLLATAESPAMLFYLDNARSVADPEHRPAGFARAGAFVRAAATGKGPKGLNENYARELHGAPHARRGRRLHAEGRSQSSPACFTGWSISLDREAEPGRFVFRARLHDDREKNVLGQRFPAGRGMDEGEQAIRMLAGRPRRPGTWPSSSASASWPTRLPRARRAGGRSDSSPRAAT